NRYKDLSAHYKDSSIETNPEEKMITILLAFENGIDEEVVKVQNKECFETKEGHAWVDRCYIRGSIHFEQESWSIEAISKGVTVPKACVQASLNANCSETAGKFIAECYQGCTHDNWHE